MNLTDRIAAILRDGPLSIFDICAALKRGAGVERSFTYVAPRKVCPETQRARDQDVRDAMIEHHATLRSLGLDLRSVVTALTKSHRFQPQTKDGHRYQCGRLARPECLWTLVGN